MKPRSTAELDHTSANSIERLDTPVGSQLVTLAGAGTRWRIAFAFDVPRAPSVDQSTADGLQTAQVTDNTQQPDRACPQR